MSSRISGGATTSTPRRTTTNGSPKASRSSRPDWFFNQWVYGTAIPKYTSNLQVQDAGNGKYHITGSITQSDVPDNFVVVMPLYIEFDKGSIVRLGNVGISGNATKPVDAQVSL